MKKNYARADCRLQTAPGGGGWRASRGLCRARGSAPPAATPAQPPANVTARARLAQRPQARFGGSWDGEAGSGLEHGGGRRGAVPGPLSSKTDNEQRVDQKAKKRREKKRGKDRKTEGK
eukprot:3329720-Rhodomonas_salina.2